MKEFDLIKDLIRDLKSNNGVILGPGDDTACLHVGKDDSPILITTDMIMDSVHFRLEDDPPFWVGHKALAVNLSDIAAMGGWPTCCVIAIALPRNCSYDLAKDLYAGIRHLAESYNVAIVGGDTNTWKGPLTISITVIGTPHKSGILTRGGALLGDRILVTGSLGGSILGRHLKFRPRLDEVKILMDRYPINSMIDISDGLGSDLRHILNASGCGAIIDKEAIPIANSLAKLTDREEALKRALSDGEDFELCFTVTPQTATRIMAENHFQDPPISIIGSCIDKPGLFWHTPDGKEMELKATGFEHSFD